MKILQLCIRIPYPPADGGSIAMHSLGQSLLKQGAEVKLLAMNTSRHYIKLDSLPADYKTRTKIEAVDIDTRIKPFDAFKNLFTSESYNIKRFDNPAVHQKLRTVLAEGNFDVVQFESLFAAPYLQTVRENSNAKCVLRSHNVEHIIWQRMADGSTNYLRKIYLRMLAKRLKKYESEIIGKFDAILPMTKEDAEIFSEINPAVKQKIIPIGLNPETYPYNENRIETLSVFHLGAMDWMPNREAVEWFLENCWHEIKKNFPSLKLYLAGRGFPDSIKIDDSNIIYDETVTNAVDYMKSKSVMIVPLLSGSGMRVKILQAFALGLPVVSTDIGAEGIECTDGENIIIADSPADFSKAVLTLMNDSQLRKKTGRNARNLFMEKYSSARIAEDVIRFYESLIKRPTESNVYSTNTR
jgi:glycosyltransferase involved in cell wall biosynthesis